MTDERQRSIWAEVRWVLSTTDCQPKTVYTARVALLRTRAALAAVDAYFEEEDERRRREPAKPFYPPSGRW